MNLRRQDIQIIRSNEGTSVAITNHIDDDLQRVEAMSFSLPAGDKSLDYHCSELLQTIQRLLSNNNSNEVVDRVNEALSEDN